MQRKSMGYSRFPQGLHSTPFFDNANVRGQRPGGALVAYDALIVGTKNGDQCATGILPVLEHGRDGHGTLPGGLRPVRTDREPPLRKHASHGGCGNGCSGGFMPPFACRND